MFDVGGGASITSAVVGKGEVTSTTRTVLGDVALIGGLVRLSGISTKAVTGTNGKKETAEGKARYGTLAIGPASFSGPDGWLELTWIG